MIASQPQQCTVRAFNLAMTAGTSALCDTKSSKFLRSLVLRLWAYLLGITIVLGDHLVSASAGQPTLRLGLWGTALFYFTAAARASPCTVSVHSAILLRLLESSLGVAVDGKGRVMCPVVTFSDTCFLLWHDLLVAPGQSRVRLKTLIAALSSVSQPHRHRCCFCSKEA